MAGFTKGVPKMSKADWKRYERQDAKKRKDWEKEKKKFWEDGGYQNNQ